MRYQSSLLHFAKLYPKMEGFIRDGHEEEMKKKHHFGSCLKHTIIFKDIYESFTPSDIATILGLSNMGSTLKHTGMKGVKVKHTTFMKRPLVIATNGMNESAIEKSTQQLRMSEMDVKCEIAEIKVDLLMESLMIVDNDLEATRIQIESLIEENKKLKKLLAEIQNMGLYLSDKNIFKESYFMSAYIWDFKISNNIKALETFLYNPLLKVFGKYDMIFFPIRHGFKDHYTLALLDTIEGKCKMVMEFLKHHQKRSRYALLEGVIIKGLFHLDSSPLDCDVLVLYYMEHMSKMWLIMKNFDEDELLEYRATFVCAFLNDESKWRPPTYSQGYVSNIRYI
ncbi:hypothetical protein D8674_021717 [Pyrus ussuriensis x Pyrus communis]|uniref:Ubiquitin-like protease family profile domain-containing protein n=1 Tax=Pyrus ussuriensis x Pyrus communis TaxID=2448454 RepID=A0A5N5GHX2_9ROSA|nr:hypothetical protein D8674_021717 [Pyrus ussuriensis x Pyrus communis]